MHEAGTGLRRKKDFEQSRRDFHRAAMELLAEKGYHLTSIDDIAARAGRSKGGFYHHFASKAQLYTEVFDLVLEQASRRIAAGLQTNRSSREVLLDLIEETKSTMTDVRFMRTAVDFFLIAARHDDAKEILRTLYARSCAMFADFFRAAIARGEFEPSIDPVRTAEVLFSTSRGIAIFTTILNEGSEMPDQLRLYVELLFRGLERRAPVN